MEIAGRKRHFQRLPANGVAAAVVQFIVNDGLVANRGAGLDPALLVAQPHDLPHHEKLARGVLLDDARLLDCRDKGPGRTVTAWHFGLIDPDLAVIDVHAGQGRHDVLDHLDRCPTGAKHSPPRHLDAVAYRRGNSRTSGQIGPHENDPLPGLGRAELDPDIASAPVANPFDRRCGR